MPAPLGTDPELANYLKALENRVGKLETPQGPTTLFAMKSASLTKANAVTYTYCQVFVSDLNTSAVSNGAHWFRYDTGATII